MPTILIVDDTPIVLEGTALSVESFGFSVDKATSGQDAIELCRTRQYAAIIMDCSMPRMDGFECTRQMRMYQTQDGSHVPIIGFSSDSDRDIRERCLAAGMDEFIPKDCSQNKLLETLKRWAGEPDAVQEKGNFSATSPNRSQF